MATAVALPTKEPVTAVAVRTCYDLMTVAPACGITDLTDGKYTDEGDNESSYLAAQARQAEYLLDEAGCGPGSRLLDIGCGYGRIVDCATRRGAAAVGITISPPQVAHCRARGLSVYELNYRNIFRDMPEWEGSYDAIVANGSLEHFVQATDAAAERSDALYEEMFAICRRLLAAGGRVVTTAIHFRQAGQFEPADILRGPRAHPRGSPNYHFAMLVERFGGWYPEPGQLERCAADQFELVREEDGTRDYHRTSEYWLRQFKRRLVCDPRVWWSVARQLWQRPGPAWQMLQLQLWDQSWAWQFREPAPMQLLRQTWAAKT
jgi:cyclopropane fatty-acyl-phospholipid synthase-like methyltransferase